MHTLNHINLTTYDVPALRSFLETIFGFQTLASRGSKLAVLRDAAGFSVVLLFDKTMTPAQGYPGFFHIGFRQQTRQAVEECYAALDAAGYHAPAPSLLSHIGAPTYGFYCEAPGGVRVEVSSTQA